MKATPMDSALSLHSRIRSALFGFLVTLLLCLIGFGGYTAFALHELSQKDNSYIHEYLSRSEALLRLESDFNITSAAVRDFMLSQDEPESIQSRNLAQAKWPEVLADVQSYRARSKENQNQTNQLEQQLRDFWNFAESTLAMDERQRQKQGNEAYYRTGGQFREEILHEIGKLFSADRLQIMSDVEMAETKVRKVESGLWIAIFLTCALSILAVVGTFRHINRLETEAGIQRDLAVQYGVALQGLSNRLILSQEEERKRIARDLHDDYGQRLAGLLFEISYLSELKETPQVSEHLKSIGERLGIIARDMQTLSRSLHSAVLEKIGLAAAIRSDCAALAQHSSLTVTFQADNVPRNLPENIALIFYRISQEAVHNAVKHSGSQAIDILLKVSQDVLTLRIQDYGQGFDAQRLVAEGEGLGVVSMRERLRMIEGTLSVESKPDEGTIVTAQAALYLRQTTDHT